MVVATSREEQQQEGFTLIELLVTMMLLTIVLLGLAGLQVTTIRQVTDAKRANQATRLVQLVLEKYRTMEWTKLENLYTTTGPGCSGACEFSDEFTTALYAGTQMQNVRPERDSDGRFLPGPFHVQCMQEPIGGGLLVTCMASWMSQTRTGDTDPLKQYKMRRVAMALHRYQL